MVGCGKGREEEGPAKSAADLSEEDGPSTQPLRGERFGRERPAAASGFATVWPLMPVKISHPGVPVNSFFLWQEHGGKAIFRPMPPPAITDRDELVAALRASDWIVCRAAKLLGVSRQTLNLTIQRLGVVKRRPSRAFFRERARLAGSAPKRRRDRLKETA